MFVHNATLLALTAEKLGFRHHLHLLAAFSELQPCPGDKATRSVTLISEEGGKSGREAKARGGGGGGGGWHPTESTLNYAL